jgi:hypothetical protein
LIGRVKLNDAFKILDSFKEDEIQVSDFIFVFVQIQTKNLNLLNLKPKLISLLGKQVYDANKGKLWLLKFCKDTAKISMR